MSKEKVISEDVALNDLEAFINEWVEKPEPKDKLAESYPNILESLMDGNLLLENKVPVYTLVSPVKNVKGEASVSEITFRTRISPSNQASLGKGLNIQLDQLQYALNCISYIINQPIAIIDNFGKRDYAAVREIASVFM
jgi:hypothetical protein